MFILSLSLSYNVRHFGPFVFVHVIPSNPPRHENLSGDQNPSGQVVCRPSPAFSSLFSSLFLFSFLSERVRLQRHCPPVKIPPFQNEKKNPRFTVPTDNHSARFLSHRQTMRLSVRQPLLGGITVCIARAVVRCGSSRAAASRSGAASAAAMAPSSALASSLKLTALQGESCLGCDSQLISFERSDCVPCDPFECGRRFELRLELNLTLSVDS